MPILDHVTLAVGDYARSKAFGTGPTSFQKAEHLRAITPTHLAFSATSRAEVDAFYRAALEAGGKDYGAPGVRAHYHPNYYGAFVLDPDGHDIEAVFQGQ
jgi:catechol 2,3-dioxygenase-like lactoylglutathione lyase family enzyme